MGSVVKSKSWKMDRKNDREIFRGDVSFKNRHYNLKSDYAEYKHKTKRWQLEGNVFCQRFFEDKTNIDLTCDKGVFFEEFENAVLYAGKKQVKAFYRSIDDRTLTAYCDKVNVDNKKDIIDFKGNFILRNQINHAYSDNATYENEKGIFTLYGSKPIAMGQEKGYNFAIQGDVLIFYKEKNDIEASGQVKGWADIKTGAKGR